MTKLVRATYAAVTYPLQAGRSMVDINMRLWQKTFWDAWEPLPLDSKLAWIAFISQTLAILTLIELFILKK